MIVSYRDTKTGARLNITQPIEIIAEGTYELYLKREIFEEQVDVYEAARIEMSAAKAAWTPKEEKDDEDFGGKGDFDFDFDEGGKKGGDFDWSDFGFGFGDGKSGGKGGKSSRGGSSSGSNQSGSEPETETVCTDEIYYEEVEYANEFVAVEDEQYLID